MLSSWNHPVPPPTFQASTSGQHVAGQEVIREGWWQQKPRDEGNTSPWPGELTGQSSGGKEHTIEDVSVPSVWPGIPLGAGARFLLTTPESHLGFFDE